MLPPKINVGSAAFGKQPHLFFREGGWYPIELASDEEARRNAEINPGTIRVEDMAGNVVWRPQ